jgi:hypothetical protein
LRPTLTAVAAAVAIAGAACQPTWPPAADPSFPLVGRHEPLACVACHPADRALGPVPAACASCHEAARPADHYAGDCGECHTPYGWDDIVVDHTFFPLTEAHALPCDACHADGYGGLDPACASCHEADRPPDHFGTQDCGSCHVPTNWGDATFDHDDLFPLPHHGVGDCGSCHLEPGSYASFSCIDCHEHARAETDEDHDEVSGYEHTSDACLRCHPRGGGGDR